MNDRPYLRLREGGEDTPAGTALRNWHGWLTTHRGARAALRRVRGLDEVWLEEAYSRLRLPLLKLGSFSDNALARAAVALSEVDTGTAGTIAARLAAVLRPAEGGAAPQVRLLLGAEDPDEFLRLLRSLIQRLDRKVDLVDLAELVLAWHHPASRAAARKRVMLAYYEHAAGLADAPEEVA